MPRWAVFFVLGTILLVTPACRSDSLFELPVGDEVFLVEIADDAQERQRGLMFRRELPPDQGMLFVFPDSRPRSFWMKDTPLPLSLAYISAEGRILEIHDLEPLSLTPVRSRFPARYALEVNQGRFEELGIAVGDYVDVSELPDSP